MSCVGDFDEHHILIDREAIIVFKEFSLFLIKGLLFMQIEKSSIVTVLFTVNTKNGILSSGGETGRD